MGSNVLLKNDGHGHFIDVTAKAGVASSGWSTSAAFVDYDGDGALDLFVAHYLNWRRSAEVECFSLTGVPDYCSPASYDLPSASSLYHNNGDGTFTDVSARSGVTAAVGNGLGVVAGDFDGDGRIDVLGGERPHAESPLAEPGGRPLSRGGASRWAAPLDQDGLAKSGMGVDAVDVDDDGDLDLLVVNLDGESDSFFRNQGKFFVDDTVSVGLRTPSRPFTRFGMALRDFDNDGYLDLYEANGRVGRQSELYSSGSVRGTQPAVSRAARGRASRRWRRAAARGRC